VKPDVDDVGVSPSATAAPQKAGGITTFPDESPVAAPYTQFTRTVRISDCVAGAGCGTGIVGPTGQRQVTVTVSYRPLTGRGQAAAGTTKSAIVTLVVGKGGGPWGGWGGTSAASPSRSSWSSWR